MITLVIRILESIEKVALLIATIIVFQHLMNTAAAAAAGSVLPDIIKEEHIIKWTQDITCDDMIEELALDTIEFIEEDYLAQSVSLPREFIIPGSQWNCFCTYFGFSGGIVHRESYDSPVVLLSKRHPYTILPFYPHVNYNRLSAEVSLQQLKDYEKQAIMLHLEKYPVIHLMEHNKELNDNLFQLYTTEYSSTADLRFEGTKRSLDGDVIMEEATLPDKSTKRVRFESKDENEDEMEID